VECASSGLLEDFLLLLLKFLLRQHAGFAQLSEQPELGKLIALCGRPGLALLILVLPLLPSKQVAQPADDQLTQQAAAAKRRQARSSQKGTSPIPGVMSLHGVAPSRCFQENFCCFRNGPSGSNYFLSFAIRMSQPFDAKKEKERGHRPEFCVKGLCCENGKDAVNSTVF
jgi:hypothetical protein